jgi:oxygen-independent coproporphyrinogen-3 oxidase
MVLALPTQSGALDLAGLPDGPMSGLYVHVPFCFHKCHYCDFYSIVGQTPDRMARYVDRVLAEAALWSAARPNLPGQITTVFFGGGTPSLLPPPDMVRLITGLGSALGLSAVEEWTIECNPATVDADYLSRLRAAGVDRLSFGAQSFKPADLKMLERHHDPDDVPRSVDLARRAGFSRLNIDLIFGTPGQSLDDWEFSLRAGLALNTGHLSAYLLTYEPNTPMAVKKRLGTITAADETVELAMLSRTRALVRAHGLAPYEISNHAAPGQECRHNLMYWHGKNYIGLGPGGASHVEGHRWRNKPHIGEWESAIDARRVAAFELELLTPDQRAHEIAYLMIRLANGVPWSAVPDAKVRFASALAKLRPLGLIDVDAEGFRLTERGIPLADAVASELLE